MFLSFPLHLPAHQDHGLVFAVAGANGLGVAAKLLKPQALVKTDCTLILLKGVKFDLFIAGAFCALDASQHQGLPKTQTPIGFVDADSEICPVPDLLPPSDTFNAGHADDLAIEDGQKLDFIFAFSLFLEKPGFIFERKTFLVGIT